MIFEFQFELFVLLVIQYRLKRNCQIQHIDFAQRWLFSGSHIMIFNERNGNQNKENL